jgi:arsenate reductase
MAESYGIRHEPLEGGVVNHPIRVLFLCAGNSARSQMAKGLHPLAVEAMREAGVDISGQCSKSLDAFLGQNFDYVITVCDRAHDRCPTFPGDNERIHWGFDDPAVETGDAAKLLAIFRGVRNEISGRLRIWVTVQRKRLTEQQPIP